MRLAQKLVVVTLALAMLTLAGCKKKKPAIPQPQAQAPTITVPVQPQPQPPPPTTTTTQPATTPPAVTAPAPTTNKPTAAKPKPRHQAKKAATTTPPAKPSAAVPSSGTTVAKNNPKPLGEGNDSGVQISAEVPQGQAAQRRQDTNQLLDSTEINLRKVGGRTLNDTDQATMRQIRNYITQSRLAIQDGDLERAYNLATKANLLCNELVKRL